MTSLTAHGRLTRDPELRFTAKGTPVANFSLACAVAGSKEIQTSFIDFKAWGGLANTLSKLTKGDLVLCWGTPSTESWDDKATGAKRSKLLFTVVGLAVGEAEERTQQRAPAPAVTAQTRSAPPPAAAPPPDSQSDNDDDVPF